MSNTLIYIGTALIFGTAGFIIGATLVSFGAEIQSQKKMTAFEIEAQKQLINQSAERYNAGVKDGRRLEKEAQALGGFGGEL